VAILFGYGLITFALIVLAIYVRSESGWLLSPRSVWVWVVLAVLAWPVVLPVGLCALGVLRARRALAR